MQDTVVPEEDDIISLTAINGTAPSLPQHQTINVTLSGRLQAYQISQTTADHAPSTGRPLFTQLT